MAIIQDIEFYRFDPTLNDYVKLSSGDFSNPLYVRLDSTSGSGMVYQLFFKKAGTTNYKNLSLGFQNTDTLKQNTAGIVAKLRYGDKIPTDSDWDKTEAFNALTIDDGLPDPLEDADYHSFWLLVEVKPYSPPNVVRVRLEMNGEAVV